MSAAARPFPHARTALPQVVAKTAGYSGSDMRNLIQEACQGPVRDAVARVGDAVASLTDADLRPVRDAPAGGRRVHGWLFVCLGAAGGARARCVGSTDRVCWPRVCSSSTGARPSLSLSHTHTWKYESVCVCVFECATANML